MPKDWKQINIDEILNFNHADTGLMAQYERIMRQKEIEALDRIIRNTWFYPYSLATLNK